MLHLCHFKMKLVLLISIKSSLKKLKRPNCTCNYRTRMLINTSVYRESHRSISPSPLAPSRESRRSYTHVRVRPPGCECSRSVSSRDTVGIQLSGASSVDCRHCRVAAVHIRCFAELDTARRIRVCWQCLQGGSSRRAQLLLLLLHVNVAVAGLIIAENAVKWNRARVSYSSLTVRRGTALGSRERYRERL